MKFINGIKKILGFKDDAGDSFPDQQPHIPPRINNEPNIILTTRCNGRCIYCSANGEDRHMSIDGVRFSVFNSGHNALVFEGGEPLLCLDLEYWVRMARKSGVEEAHILTNGYLLNSERLESLFEAGATHFHFNFPSHISEIHETLTDLKGHFEKQVASISRVYDKNPESLVLVCVVNSLNYKYLADYVEFVAKKFPKLFYIAFNSIKVMGNVRRRRNLVPRLTEVSPYLISALKKAKELHIPCLCDGFPLCVLKGWEVYSRDIEHLLRGNPTYLKEKEAVRQCRKCTLSDLCAGIRKDYVYVHGKSEVKASSLSPEPIIAMVNKGQLGLNQPNHQHQFMRNK